MATVSLSALSTAPQSSRVTDSHKTHKLSIFVPIRSLCVHSCNKVSFSPLTLKKQRNYQKVRASEEETAVVDEQAPPPQQEAPESEQPTVSVPVSPSDKLTMYFQAEGIMSEAAIPKVTVTQALEGMEGVTDLQVQILEGIASVELAKQTTVQATGVASGLVEVIQGSGFKLQTLNLSFQEEDYSWRKIMAIQGAAMNYQIVQLSTVNAALPILRFRSNLCKVLYSSKRGKLGSCVAERCTSVRTCVAESNKVSSLESRQAIWEDPDDGSESDYDEEEAEESDLYFESDWEAENDAAASTSNDDKNTTSNYEDNLVKEVELLLGPEERAILQQNATPDFDKISTVKWQPLHTLALSGQIYFMDKLLSEEGIDINHVDKDGLTALHKAIIGKKEAVISHLLRKGASPHIRDRDGATVLHYAVHVSAVQTVKLLIKYEVDINVADHEGWTPLHIAVQTRNRVIVKILLVNGADKTRRNKDGKTPLDLALCYGKDFKSYDLAKLLKIVPATDLL